MSPVRPDHEPLLSRDPLRLQDYASLYTYVADNPMGYTHASALKRSASDSAGGQLATLLTATSTITAATYTPLLQHARQTARSFSDSSPGLSRFTALSSLFDRVPVLPLALDL